MRLNKKVEAEIAIAAVVVASVVVGFLAYQYGKSSASCLYPTERSSVLLNMFGKIVAVPPGEEVEGDWGKAYYQSRCSEAELKLEFKSGLKIYIEGKPNGNLVVTSEFNGKKCTKEIEAVPVLPYVTVTATVNRVLVSAYGRILVIDLQPELSCRIAGVGGGR
ncbi:hypothetical protein [Ignicoccus hospitalis]|uniref:Uncharacterized protein n=1 Tax=Ignicoccus hospitalis (strain KIN4/I / DSM 18386 / JCM 14125) TaxID=453591 RepID=A8ABG4_IGNH4|nr:hypothetical protein [Ignicoccus hospitalis]ABU82266.1 hypothetical protein Igni_1089 [Ignicoccus hospitalis KIN4/I]HIH90815.1 hypothetical protein [Desulfurococcaceae archaeon]